MRTLHELYLILWEEIKDKEKILGLCLIINDLCLNDIITVDEHYLLTKHFKSNKPNINLHPEFLESNTWIGNAGYWWNNKEDDNPVNRKEFIQKIIEITKEL